MSVHGSANKLKPCHIPDSPFSKSVICQQTLDPIKIFGHSEQIREEGKHYRLWQLHQGETNRRHEPKLFLPWRFLLVSVLFLLILFDTNSHPEDEAAAILPAG